MASLTAGLTTPATVAILLLVSLLANPTSAANFTCLAAAATTCQSAIVYTSPNATTYGELLTRFNTTTLRDLLGANDLAETTPSTTAVAANSTIRIPFRCRCDGKVGQSDHHPVYVVQPQDGLDAIARNVFNAYVTYQEIATANNIPDPNKILVNQTLWIPLPCSCDKVEGSDVIHLAYSVASKETTAGIAAKYGVTESTLLKTNQIDDPKKLQMGQILDVPQPVCRSSISDTSADHNLMLLPNGTYAFTAQNCIRCSCSASTNQLNCTAVQGKGCPSVPQCSAILKLGDSNGTGCGSTTCAYAGYSNSPFSIQTSLAANQTTDCQKGGSGRSQFAGSMWSMSVISFHMALIIICLL
uniref:LysM domain-containing protein n=1 Tax=Leersia perrieri TaxID=77586 RepID=A0A0D9VP79_9ORYZ